MIRRWMATAAALTAALLTAGVANAASSSTEAVTRPVGKDPSAQVPVPTNSLGTPFMVRTGLFVEGQLGVFTAFGGAKGASNAQPFTALQLGFDIPGVKRLSAFLGVSHGANDGSCHYYAKTSIGNQCYPFAVPNNSSQGEAPADFSVVPIEVGARYGFQDVLLPNLFPYVMATVGYSMFTPVLTQGGASGAPHVGIGGGLQIGTHLQGFSFGVEVLFRLAIVPNAAVPTDLATAFPEATAGGLPVIPSFTAYPRFQYVF